MSRSANPSQPAQAGISHGSARVSLPTRLTQLTLGGTEYRIHHPVSASALLDLVEYQADDRVPYWAELWPAGVTLADWLSRQQGARRRLLELGCGLGLTSAVAARCGFRVTATDLHAEALEFTLQNAAANDVVLEAALQCDWPQPDALLREFDVVLAADVLYEPANCSAVAACIARCLAPEGMGFVADPQRGTAAEFVSSCAAAGLIAETPPPLPYLHWREVGTGRKGQKIDLYVLRHQPA